MSQHYDILCKNNCETTDNILIMPVSVFKVVVMELGGQRKECKENDGKSEKDLTDMSLDSVTTYMESTSRIGYGDLGPTG